MKSYSFKGVLEGLISVETLIAKYWTSKAYRRLMLVQWGLQPKPQHFDHHIDLFYKWLNTRDSMWLERGVFSSIALKGGDVLELACGDGFNSRNFYSLRSRRVLACDFDKRAIEKARKNNLAPNISYEIADIRNAMPEGEFDNVIWDFGFPLLEYFTEPEVAHIIKNIKLRISQKNGIFSGYTIAQIKSEGLGTQDLIFSSAKELHDYLSKFFINIFVLETKSTDRTNFYFWASDSSIPFGEIKG